MESTKVAPDNRILWMQSGIHQFHQFVPTLDTLFSQKFKFLGHMDHVEAIQDPVNRNLWMQSGIHQFHPSAQTLS